MQPITPDQASFLLRLALPSLRNEHRLTRRLIEAIPAEKGNYSPDEVSKTALNLAWHIVSSEIRFLLGVAAGEFDYRGGILPEEISNSAQLGAYYGEQFEAAVSALANLTGEQLIRIVDFRGIFQLPAVMYLQLASSHSIHHRGQLSMYLRPIGAKVPAIYGESYDSAQERKSAQV